LRAIIRSGVLRTMFAGKARSYTHEAIEYKLPDGQHHQPHNDVVETAATFLQKRDRTQIKKPPFGPEHHAEDTSAFLARRTDGLFDCGGGLVAEGIARTETCRR